MKKAFTLIELLVVVLIIGILAAIAVPQYQKAVMKTRYGSLKTLARSIANAEEVYYMANNTYSTDFEELDVQMPGGKLNDSVNRSYKYGWGWCSLDNTENISSVSCTNSLIQMSYAIRLLHSVNNPGKQLCVAYGSSDANTLQAQICKAETGRTTPSVTNADEGNRYTSYWYQ
ncbi:MAG: prepilin-type N-terminal cleavage/methylation domain-containing protein [Elusimicrobiaceae bacterium]|nr:prepilin-type N-terminal cleavage/methylation domain-containing protein [Elusimicrobiaceae bacterium]